MDLRALELPDARVGTALCLDTLEHCEDPSLREAQSHYDAGAGRVRVGVFNYEPRQLARALVAQAPRLLKERLR